MGVTVNTDVEDGRSVQIVGVLRVLVVSDSGVVPGFPGLSVPGDSSWSLWVVYNHFPSRIFIGVSLKPTVDEGSLSTSTEDWTGPGS